MKMRFLDFETTIKIRLSSILEKLYKRQRQEWTTEANVIKKQWEVEKCGFTQFLQMQKNHLVDTQECCCNILPVFGFISAQYDLNLIKSYLLPNIINERDIEPNGIKKVNQLTFFKFGDTKFLDIMTFLGGATSLENLQTSETKCCFPYERFDDVEKLQNTELPPYDTFFSKLRSWNPLEREYTEYLHLLKTGMTTNQAVTEFELTKPPPTGN